MTLLDHARTELDHVAADDPVANPKVAAGMLAIVEGFREGGHSGGSAAIVGPYLGQALGRLLAFEPLGPLTGANDEWVEVSAEIAGGTGLEQNVRCGRVFREDGIAYDIEAVVFYPLIRHRSIGFTGYGSARRVTFPYTPTTRRTRLRKLSTWVAKWRGQLRP